MTEPNPTGNLVTCAKCRKFATFSRDAVCSQCRHGMKPKTGGKDQVQR